MTRNSRTGPWHGYQTCPAVGFAAAAAIYFLAAVVLPAAAFAEAVAKMRYRLPGVTGRVSIWYSVVASGSAFISFTSSRNCEARPTGCALSSSLETSSCVSPSFTEVVSQARSSGLSDFLPPAFVAGGKASTLTLVN